jgi:hypothetical protein
MPESGQFVASDFERGLGEYSAFFLFHILSLPSSEQQIVDAFCESAILVSRAIRMNQRIEVTFGTTPFTIVEGAGTLRVNLHNPIINSTFGDFIFLDWQKMKSLKYEAIVGTILEELVHSLMNVKDERLARHIVASLYPALKISSSGPCGLADQS